MLEQDDNLQRIDGRLSAFAGCGRILILNSVHVPEELRGKGLGLLWQKNCVERARGQGYDVILCTVRNSNLAQRNIMHKLRFKTIFQFNNSKTGNLIHIFALNLQIL